MFATNNIPEKFFPYRCDVSDEEQILGILRYIRKRFGELHVHVNFFSLFFRLR